MDPIIIDYEDIFYDNTFEKLYRPKRSPCNTCIAQITCDTQCYELREALKVEAKRIMSEFSKLTQGRVEKLEPPS